MSKSAVSIHAPAWGATSWLGQLLGNAGLVSIHAPAWGATALPQPGQGEPICFNPRTRVGCDEMYRGMTAIVWGFNPRTRVGCDHIQHVAKYIRTLFQSTHPRGVRLADGRQRLAGQQVSIHAPAWGATYSPSLASLRASWQVSIHAPAWGATQFSQPRGNVFQRFNPRTRVGCDSILASSMSWTFWFQSTHPRGVRPSV